MPSGSLAKMTMSWRRTHEIRAWLRRLPWARFRSPAQRLTHWDLIEVRHRRLVGAGPVMEANTSELARVLPEISSSVTAAALAATPGMAARSGQSGPPPFSPSEWPHQRGGPAAERVVWPGVGRVIWRARSRSERVSIAKVPSSSSDTCRHLRV